MAGFVEVVLQRDKCLALLAMEYGSYQAEDLMQSFRYAEELAGRTGHFDGRWVSDLLATGGGKLALVPWFGMVKLTYGGYSPSGEDAREFMRAHGLTKGGLLYSWYGMAPRTLHP